MRREELTLNKNQSGLSALEPIIALALFSIVTTGVLATGVGAQNLVLASQLRLEALSLAQSTLEETQNNLKQNWFSPPPSNSQTSIYTVEVKSMDIDDYTKQITAKVSWSLPNRQDSLSLVAIISDWKNAADASVCGPLSGNWSAPQIISTVDLGTSNPGTSIIAKSKLLYVTADSATQTKPDFFIFDISNPYSPTLLSSLNTGPGVSSLAVSGHYAFLGNASINGQLEVVDISNPQNPILKKTYKLPGVYNDNTTIPNTLIYSRKKIYLGTAKSQISEFHMIDVSNPLVPLEQGSFEINAGINALNARGDKIFVASPASEELKVLDISIPSSIRQVGGYDAPGGSGNGKSIFRTAQTLYMGRTLGGNELTILNAENPSSLSLIISKALGTSINGITGTPAQQFLTTNDSNKKLQIWQTLSPTSVNLLASINPNGTLTSIACQRNSIFVTTSSPDGFVIIGPGT